MKNVIVVLEKWAILTANFVQIVHNKQPILQWIIFENIGFFSKLTKKIKV